MSASRDGQNLLLFYSSPSHLCGEGPRYFYRRRHVGLHPVFHKADDLEDHLHALGLLRFVVNSMIESRYFVRSKSRNRLLYCEYRRRMCWVRPRKSGTRIKIYGRLFPAIHDIGRVGRGVVGCHMRIDHVLDVQVKIYLRFVIVKRYLYSPFRIAP